MFNNIHTYDIDGDKEHQLRVGNAVGTSIFTVKYHPEETEMVTSNMNPILNPTMNDVDESCSGKEYFDEIHYDEDNNTIEINVETTNNQSQENPEENISGDKQKKDMNTIHGDKVHGEPTNIQDEDSKNKEHSGNENNNEDNIHKGKIDGVNNNAKVEIQQLINSCLALGSSLLSQ